MTLKRQLLLISIMTLMLPWAGLEFLRETESALRSQQENSLADEARAHATSLAQYVEEFPSVSGATARSDRLYLHELTRRPEIDGYFDDWLLSGSSLRSIRGAEGAIHFAAATFANDVYIYVEVIDRNVVYAATQAMMTDDGPDYADRIDLVTSSPPYLFEKYVFAAEAPGAIVGFKPNEDDEIEPERAISAHWQDYPKGYRIEAKIPAHLLGTHLGVVVSNTPDARQRATRASSFSGDVPAPIAKPSHELRNRAEKLVRNDKRMLITDAAGWRLGIAGQLSPRINDRTAAATWSQRVYGWLVESGKEARFAEPDPQGREQATYVSTALGGDEKGSWFRSGDNGQAIVAVASPIVNDSEVIGALILQQGTDAILSLTNDGLRRLIKVTFIATIVVAGALLGYATWLSRRIRHLSLAAESALENESLQSALPSALADDEVGDLSRSFSYVLQQLGDYNAYLRTLASKLSHELRTPLAIVTSSLENLEHEPLNDTAKEYTERALDGADRLRRILSAMSEASRVEELMENAVPDNFDLASVLSSTVAAYRDIYKERNIEFDRAMDSAPMLGSPELLIQMLDKLLDNAVEFSQPGDTIRVGLEGDDDILRMFVANPGPALPERMQTQMFDSMVSIRGEEDSRHLGLGLYIARLIAEGHGGRIEAKNLDDGAEFSVFLPRPELA